MYFARRSGISDFNPIVGPDGVSVAFLSTRSGSVQIWTLSVHDGESSVNQLTNFPVDVDNIMWSPTGNYLVFSSEVYVDCSTLQCTADIDQKVAARGPNTGFLYESL
jgi:Tol biopolymer transport system component